MVIEDGEPGAKSPGFFQFMSMEDLIERLEASAGDCLFCNPLHAEAAAALRSLTTGKTAPSAPVGFDRDELEQMFVDRDTSRQAAALTEKFRMTMAREIWVSLRTIGPATCAELEARLGAKHQTVSARLRDLQVLGYIADTGERRASSMKGKATAIVWRAVRASGDVASAETEASAEVPLSTS